MHLDKAIERHCEPLLRIVETLFALIGLVEGGLERLSRPVYRKVLNILRPAESAVRRLIIVMASGLEVEPATDRAGRKGRGGSGKRKGKGRRLFALFDPRLRLRFSRASRHAARTPKAEPHIYGFPYDRRVPEILQPTPSPKPDGTVSAAFLCRRLGAIIDALKDLPRQARRYARLQARLNADPNSKRDSVLRRGSPPGLREKSTHEVHEILKECHWLALTVLRPDSS